jgi:uncharacterized membrane protein
VSAPFFTPSRSARSRTSSCLSSRAAGRRRERAGGRIGAVALALVSALLFGGMSVALRMALQRSPDVALATLATSATRSSSRSCSDVRDPARGPPSRSAWPFLLAGLLSPGLAQILVTIAIRDSGSSRVSMIFGMAPLVSVTIALLILDEPVRVPLIAGAVLVVAAACCSRASATAGASEQARPRLRVRRRNAVRDPGQPRSAPGSGEDPVPPAVAAAAALARRDGARRRLGARRSRSPLAPVRPGRPPVRRLVRLALRGVLPRPRHGRRAARRYRIARRRRSLRAFPARFRAGREAARLRAALIVAGGALIGAFR